MVTSPQWGRLSAMRTCAHPKICEHCARPYVPNQPHQRFHTRRCKESAGKASSIFGKVDAGPLRPCDWCDHWFIADGRGAPRFCGDECRIEWQRVDRLTSPYQCVDCGTPLAKTGKQGKQFKRCGPCRALHLAEMQKVRWQRIKASPELLALQREKVRNNNHRRRAITADTDIDAAWLSVVRSVSIVCTLCLVEMADEHGHETSKHLDHIVPLAAGGRHVKANVRFICARCNTTRPIDAADLMTLATP